MISLTLSDRKSLESVQPATGAYGPETGFTENVAAVVQDFARENLLGSRNAAFNDRFEEQLDNARKLGITDLPAIPNHGMPSLAELEEMKQDHAPNALLRMRAAKWDDFFARMKQQHPDAGFMTIADANDDISKDFAEARQQTASIRERATLGGDIGAGLGYIAAPLQEPLVLATLPFGAAGSASILRTILTEAALASGTEALIQPEVFKFKQQIDSPYTVTDAVTNVVTAGAGAGLIAGGLKAAPIGYRALLNEIRARREAKQLPEPTPTQRAAEEFLEQYADEIESNPNRRDQPDSLPVHAENLKNSQAAVLRGEGLSPHEVKTTRLDEPERRQDMAQRQRIDGLRELIREMEGKVERGEAAPKELNKLFKKLEAAIYTDDLTGIANGRAWKEAEKKPFVASIDFDGFKWINDNMGHSVGDDFLRIAARILQEETGDAFRKGGDEFVAQAGKGASLEKALKRAQERLKKEPLEVTLPDGSKRKKIGIDFTYAIGKNFDEADLNLQPLKDERRRLRAERGGIPDGVVDTPAARNPDNLNRGASYRSTAPVRPEAVTPQTETEAFKNWFGKSQVTDESGRALVVYHGTADDFDSFKADNGGRVSGTPSAQDGFFFSRDPGTAYIYAREAAFAKDRKAYEKGAQGTIVPVYLSMQNPKRVGYGESVKSEVIKKAKAEGHDGVIDERGDYVVFKPTQIKSAIGNPGTFDPRNPSIVDTVRKSKRVARRAAEEFDANPAPRNEILQAEAQRALDENPDMMVPDADGNPVPLKQVMDEIKEDDEAVNVVNACLKGPE